LRTRMRARRCRWQSFIYRFDLKFFTVPGHFGI
jgi:hypothetical protein